MDLPRSTYRLQLRGGMDFNRAAEIVPYLARLGISHLYLSPPFEARQGSTHGYDVVDPNRLDPELGGERAFRVLCDVLRAEGMGLVLDIVPNHMGIGPDNPWWWDVLKHGRNSHYAGFFDIDFARDPDGKLVLPALGAPLEEILERGELKLGRHEVTGEPILVYYDNRFPLIVREELPGGGPDAATLKRLLEAQPYRLVFWQEGAEQRNCRRFFNIDDLAGVRVEEPEVFEASHELILDLVARDLVQGLRIDHIDGLTDPKAYLERLQRRLVEASGRPGPFYVVVEKILVGEERLPEDWPVAGTTGYEFMNEVLRLLVDPKGLAALEELAQRLTGETASYPELVRAAKEQVAEQLFPGELKALSERAAGLLDVPAAAARDALRALLVAFPVYRTYGDGQGNWRPADRAVLVQAFGAARERAEGETRSLLDRLESLLLEPPDDRARTLILGLQQLSGPMMAKSVEDTAFYRYPRLIALNEVGGEPDASGLAPEGFHALAAERLEHWPGSLLATATHDTKRGEDARARLAVLSELPDAWAEAVDRWRELTAACREGSPAIHARDEYMLYQSLVGVWPLMLAPDDRDELAALAQRLEGYLIKALREGKERSDWNAPDEAYEGAALGFLRAILDPERSGEFLEALAAFVGRIAPAGGVNSLSQLLLKLAAPGVPDIYQGTELWDLSLVDPDNRRPVDFAQNQALLDAGTDLGGLVAGWREGALKQRLIACGLDARRRFPALFAAGGYQPLALAGPHRDHLLAFARRHGEQAALAVMPRRVAGLLGNAEVPLVPPERWEDAAVLLPDEWAGRMFRDVLSGAEIAAPEDGRLQVADLLAGFPVALLLTG